jgi:hypothetical protein
LEREEREERLKIIIEKPQIHDPEKTRIKIRIVLWYNQKTNTCYEQVYGK